MGGGKGGSSTYSVPAPAYAKPVDLAEQTASIQAIMRSITGDGTGTNTTFKPPDTIAQPATQTVAPMDFTKEQEALQNKINSVVIDELAKKRGRASTVLTDPAMEEIISTLKPSILGA
jgi:hypothetical protein